MTLVFVSNFLNHHQIPLCTAFEKKCDKFYFVATEDILSGGYQKLSNASYVVHYYRKNEREFAKRLIVDADVVLFGACPYDLISLRMQHKKLTFLYSERFFKKGKWRRFIPQVRRGVLERVARYKNEPMYVLAASAYLTEDLSYFGFPSEKCYRWGYFPETKYYDNIDLMLQNKEKNQVVKLLWVGRFLEWKHPELAVNVAKKLSDEGYKFELDIVGGGGLEETLSTMIEKWNFEECVHLLGSMSPSEVREKMEQANIFLFTSDRKEGWGAVLNEAMNSCCAVVANRAIGSVPYLINHGVNGMVYDTEEELYQYVKLLLDRPKQCVSLGNSAYQTMIDEWNSEIAAERFLYIVEDIEKNGISKRYQSGPCSHVQ